MATDKNPLIEMMRRIRLDIFDRSNRGTLNYAGDIAILRKHLELAREMNDPVLVAQTYNALGCLEMNMGYFAHGEAYLRDGAEVAQQAPEHSIGGALQNNLGENYRRWGRFQDAIAAFEKAEKHGRAIEQKKTVVIALDNTGLSWLALNQYDEAERNFRAVEALIKDDPWDFISTLIEMKHGLAEVYLARRDFEGAWALAEEAETLARGRNFQVPLAHTLIVKAHIAEADPSRHHLAHDYYRAAREGLREHGTPILLARTLLEEARYQQRHGNIEEVVRLATEARSRFAELGLDEEAGLAETLLNSPAQAV